MAYDHILTPDLHHLAMSTRNGGLMEELRARTCENRWDPNVKDCECWAFSATAWTVISNSSYTATVLPGLKRQVLLLGVRDE